MGLLAESLHQEEKVPVSVTFLKMRKPRLRKGKWRAQGCPADASWMPLFT